LINSCRDNNACQSVNGDRAFDELIDCCNDNNQCKDKDELDIVAAGCVSVSCVYCLNAISNNLTHTFLIFVYKMQPSKPRVTSLTVVEPDGVSKTVNCCESGDDNNECQALLAIAEAEPLDECVAPSTSEQPSLVPSTQPSAQPSIVPSESGVPSLMVSVCSCFFVSSTTTTVHASITNIIFCIIHSAG